MMHEVRDQIEFERRLDEAPFDPRAIANLILDYADESNKKITHLSLQKLIYFVHGWYLSNFRKPLVSELAEAWTHGPVFRSVYNQFRNCRREPIFFRASVYDYFSEKFFIPISNIEDPERIFINNVLMYYFNFSASELRRISHVENGPWDRIWKEGLQGALPGMKIPNDLILNYFFQISENPH